MPLNKLKEFETKIHGPFGGIKYTALKNALHNYYNTLNAIDGDLSLTFFSLPEEETEFDNDNHQFEGYQDAFISTIINFHHFVELHIKEILYQCHPLLATDMRKMDNATVLEYLESEKIIPSDRSIDFNTALELLKDLKKSRDSVGKKFILDSKHDFLLELHNRNIIKKLFEYRNASLHKADVLLPYIAFDYFISQHVLPLIKGILDTEPDYEYLNIERQTASGIKVLKEILEVKFVISDLKKDASNAFIKKIEKLAHLKELGRSSYNIPTSIPVNLLKQKISKLIEDDDDTDLEFGLSNKDLLEKCELAEELAKIESEHVKVHNIHICPCCGAKTLLSYWKVDFPMPEMPIAYIEVNDAKCNFCGYAINASMNDPHKFKITKEKIFDTIEMGWPFDSLAPTTEDITLAYKGYAIITKKKSLPQKSNL